MSSVATRRRHRRRLYNTFVIALLRSPLHRVLSGAVILLRIRGRRSGRRFSLPAQYAQDGDALWIVPGHAQRKTWWRNLVDAAPVEVRLRGRVWTGIGRVVTPDREPERFAQGRDRYVARFRAAAKLEIPVVVRVELGAEARRIASAA